MNFKRLLKWLLVFSACMIITKTLPVKTLSCDDAWYISLAMTTLFVILEFHLPTYKITVIENHTEKIE